MDKKKELKIKASSSVHDIRMWDCQLLKKFEQIYNYKCLVQELLKILED